MSTRRRALGPLLILAAAAALGVPGQAVAHAVLVGSDPADGARLASSPQQIRLWFNEDVSRKLSEVNLAGARTGRVAGVEVHANSGRTLGVSLPELRRDTYILRWRTVSEDDLHVTSGSLVFGVRAAVRRASGTASATLSQVSLGPEKAEVVLRWIDFAAIAVLIGSLALIAVCIPRAARRGAGGLGSARRRLARLAAVSAAVALCTGVGLLLVQAHGLSTESIGSALGTVLTQTSYGPSWIARELLIYALYVLALMLGRRRPGALLVALIALCSLALCVSLALNSHSASARGQLSVATTVLALHLLSAALWAGGVCALAIVLIGTWTQSHPHGSARLLLRSFSGFAAVSVAVLALTGLYSAGVGVGSPDALITTLYGRTLLAKTALFTVIGMVGLANSLLIRSGRHRSRWLGRGARLEAALAAGVILLAALLTATAPARGPRLVALRAAAPAPESVKSAQAGDLLVSLTVKPNQPGVNFVTAGVFNTRRPAPAPIRAVEFSIGRTGGGRWLRAARARDRYWQLVGNEFGRVGAWSIGVRISRRRLPTQLVRIPWAVRPPRARVSLDRPAVSGRPLAAIVSPAAAAGAVGLAVALLGLALRGSQASPLRWARPRDRSSRRDGSLPNPTR